MNKNGPTMPHMSSACWVWTGGLDGRKQYGIVWVGGRNAGQAHRFAWERANGPVPRGMWVCHHCDNPRCVRSEPDGAGHLFLGTPLDNARDMASKGRGIWQRGEEAERWGEAIAKAQLGSPAKRRGEASHFAKLTEESVRTIIEAVAAGARQIDLARRFGVTAGAICRIVSGENWAHLR